MARREQLVETKYQVAGGSAWLMFGVEAKRAVTVIEDAWSAVTDLNCLLNGRLTPSAGPLAQIMFATYKRLDEPRFVSAFAARLVATAVEPKTIDWRFAVAPSVNNQAQQFQPWLVASLGRNGFTCQACDGQPLHWPPRSVRFINTLDEVANLQVGWNLAKPWHPAGFDAVHVEEAELNGGPRRRLLFVALVNADTREITPEPYRTLLQRTEQIPSKSPTVNRDSLRIVDLIYIVPLTRPWTFRLPVTNLQFAKEVLAVALPDSWTSLMCSVRVVGVQSPRG